MAEEYYSILTTIGQGKIASAVAAGTKVTLTQFALGDGGGASYDPAESQIALKHEVYRANVSSVAVADTSINIIEINMSVPASVGGWTVREMGIFDETGDLIAIAKTPDDPKPAAESGAAKDVIYRMFILVTNADTVEIKIDPNVRLATKDELEAVKLNLQGQIDTMSAELGDSITEVSSKIGQSTDAASAKTLFGGQVSMKSKISDVLSTAISTEKEINSISDIVDDMTYGTELKGYYRKYEKWTKSSIGAKAACASTSSKNAENNGYYIVGDNGMIKRRRTNVNTWETVVSNTTSNLNDIIEFVIDGDYNRKLIACGDGATNNIVLSADGGGTWVAKTLPATPPSTNGQFIYHSYDKILLLYYPGYATYFRSADLGESWIKYSFPSDCTPLSLSYDTGSHSEGEYIFALGTDYNQPFKMSKDGITWDTRTSSKIDLSKVRIAQIFPHNYNQVVLIEGTLPNVTPVIKDSYAEINLNPTSANPDIIPYIGEFPHPSESHIYLNKAKVLYDRSNSYATGIKFLVFPQEYSSWKRAYEIVRSDLHNVICTLREMDNAFPISAAAQTLQEYGNNIVIAGKGDVYIFDNSISNMNKKMDYGDRFDAVYQHNGKQVFTGPKGAYHEFVFSVPRGVRYIYIEACAGGEDATTTVSGSGGGCFRGGFEVSSDDEIVVQIGDSGSIRISGLKHDLTLGSGYGAAPGEASMFASGGFRFNIAGGGGGYGGGGAPGVNAATMISLPGDGKGGPGGLPGCGGAGNPQVADVYSSYNGGNGGYGAGGGAPYNTSYKPGKGGPGIVVIYY